MNVRYNKTTKETEEEKIRSALEKAERAAKIWSDVEDKHSDSIPLSVEMKKDCMATLYEVARDRYGINLNETSCFVVNANNYCMVDFSDNERYEILNISISVTKENIEKIIAVKR